MSNLPTTESPACSQEGWAVSQQEICSWSEQSAHFPPASPTSGSLKKQLSVNHCLNWKAALPSPFLSRQSCSAQEPSAATAAAREEGTQGFMLHFLISKTEISQT